MSHSVWWSVWKNWCGKKIDAISISKVHNLTWSYNGEEDRFCLTCNFDVIYIYYIKMHIKCIPHEHRFKYFSMGYMEY